MSRLPINLNDLLYQRTVEGERIEYKEGWNPDPIIRTLCAFANDFENLGGGYLIIGLQEEEGKPVLPPVGVPDTQLNKIQHELLQYCKQIQPQYSPILNIETFENKNLVVLWAPGGQNRPYKAPKEVTNKQKEYRYYIRRFANTIEAKDGDERELLSLTATIPFDDRICHQAELSDLKLPLIRSFLREVGSGLYEAAARTPLDILCRQMNIVDGADEYLKPRNVGIMFFHESPEQFFPGAQIEVVHFPEGVAGKNIEERIFKGPLDQQLRDALAYLRNIVIKERVTKLADRAEAQRIFNYPYAALEEALVNAVYHRSYEQREPIEVRIHPGRIEITSYPGPDASIRLEALNSGKIAARRYRNRRLGEFLKELKLTEGRATGIPTILETMKQNGSPSPRFETDEGRTYFLVELLSHSDMQDHDPHHDPHHDEDHDKLSQIELQIIQILADGPKNTSQIATKLGYARRTGSLLKAIDRLKNLNLIDLTIPDKPRSKNQRFKLTDRGYQVFEET